MTTPAPRWSLAEDTLDQEPAHVRQFHLKWRLLAGLISTSFALIMGVAVLYLHASTSKYIRSPDRESGIELVYDPLLGWRNVPNLKSHTYGKQLTTNSRGLRDREHPVQKPGGVSRILVLGDSFAWGWGVADEEIFPAVLEQLLQHSAERWEVINTGVSGWATDQEYLYLTTEGFDYSPNVVVLAVFTGNDPLDNSRSKPYGRAKPVFRDLDLKPANLPVPQPSAGDKEIWTRADPIALTLAIIAKIREVCSAHNCSLVVMKFGSYIDPADHRLQDIDQRFAQSLSEAAGVHYLDLDTHFASHGLRLNELCGGNSRAHWNAAGHQSAAHLLHAFLQKHGLLNRHSRE